MRIEDSIEIAAPVARVWELTVDVESWPEFTPTVTRIEWLSPPPIAVGSKARIKQPAQRAKVWTVTDFEPERCFAWSTKSLGLEMTGTHRMEASAKGTVQSLSILA